MASAKQAEQVRASEPALAQEIARRLPSPQGRDIRDKRPPLLSFVLRVASVRRGAAVVTMAALDFVGLAAAIFSALVLKAVVVKGSVSLADELHGTLHLLALPFILTVLLFWGAGLYASRPQRPGLTRIVASLFQVMVVAWLYAVVSGRDYRSYYIFYGSTAFALLYIPTLRHLYERVSGKILRAAGYRRRAVLVGRGQQIAEVARALAATARSKATTSPVEVVGYISPERLSPLGELRPLGTLEELEGLLSRERVDELIIADPDFPHDQALNLVETAHRRGLRVFIAPSTMELLINRAEFVPGQSVPLFELGPPVFEGINFALKRAFDLVVSAVLLVLLAPLLVAIALAIKLTSRGPILYRSVRPGIGERPFACLKFRTMYADAEHRQRELDPLNEAGGALFKIRDDPRVTAVGRFLRRFSLDELPQLVNVLRGEMSLVGPRPLPSRDYEQLADWHRKRYLVLPGMTGLWQVSGRSDLDFDDLVRLDFLYLERWSLALDLAIIAKTIPAVLLRRGAY